MLYTFVLIQIENPIGAALKSGVVFGAVFGLLFSLLMGYVFRPVEETVSIDNWDSFSSRLAASIHDLGYREDEEAQPRMVYRPSIKAGLLTGSIAVSRSGDLACITGPRPYVRKLLVRLRAV